MPSVHIIAPNPQDTSMYLNRGWEITDLVSADLVQFTGGEDVSPELYGEAVHRRTHNNLQRDGRESRAFKVAQSMGKPMAGICRGGQFLNVMCGGSMFQHVDNHAIGGTHVVYEISTNTPIPCTSTHHQMMRRGRGSVLIGVASEASTLESMKGDTVHYVKQKRGQDVEVVYYAANKTLCFQPHPEYMKQDSQCQQWYFDLIKQLLEVGDEI
jgi:gamma-glutamyl-gamma-aminobutyrate hydrolase PuuD